jgi:cell division protein FtsQ
VIGEDADDGNRPLRRGSGGLVSTPRKKWRAAFFVLAGVGILGAIAWALLGSRFLVVRAITVTGTHLVSHAQVIAAAGVPAGTPLIRVDPAQVATRVEEKIPQVASAQVSKQWPDGLAITVRERVPVMSVRMTGSKYDLVDHDGVIIRYAATRPAAMPVLQTTVPGAELRGNPGVATVAEVLTGLPPWLSRQVSSVAVNGPTVTLYLTGSRTVIWGGPDRAEVKAHELAILMRDPARYFDVSAPGTVVTR